MFKIEFAGTGGAVPLKERNLSSVLFSYAGRKIIFDVGEGTQQSLLKLHSGFVNIDIICLSHLHGDHIFGLPGLLCTMGMAKRTNDLLILAPKGSRQLLSQFVCLVGRQDYSVYVLELDSSLESSNEESLNDKTISAWANAPFSDLASAPCSKKGVLSKDDISGAANTEVTSSKRNVLLTKNGHNSAINVSKAKKVLQAKREGALALELTKFGYKINLALSDPKLVNPDNFYCLLAKKDNNTKDNVANNSLNIAHTLNNSQELAKAQAASHFKELAKAQAENNLQTQAKQIASNYEQVKCKVDMRKLFPKCNLFLTKEAPEKLLSNSRLAKKLHKYDNLRFTLAPNTPANLYISSAPQKHSVNCLAYRLDFYKAGRFHVDKAKAAGIAQAFWSYLQDGYSISYTFNQHAYKFTPATVTSPPLKLFSLAYVTDTRPLASNAIFLKDVQVLISEANYLDESKHDLAVKNRHMTLKEACLQAQLANVKYLILTHFSASVTEPSLYKESAQALFANSYLANDLDSFTFVVPKSDKTENGVRNENAKEDCLQVVLADLSNVSNKGAKEDAAD